MAGEGKKYPLVVGQFVWVVTKKDGRGRVVIGPDPLEVTDDDIFALPDRNDPTKLELMDKDRVSEAIQYFVTLQPDEYAVVFNPVSNPDAEYPNGRWQTGKNDVKTLEYGKKRVITSGYFPVWPGQKVEKRRVHRLSASQYLMILIESAAVDASSPYFGLVMKCAEIKKALVDETIDSESEDGCLTAAALSEANGEIASAANVSPAKPEGKAEATQLAAPTLVVGQRIIIPGNLAPTFIPPSGTDVVPADKEEEETPAVRAFNPASVIAEKINTGELKMEGLKGILSNSGLSEYYKAIFDRYNEQRSSGRPAHALYNAIADSLPDNAFSTLAKIWQTPGAGKAKTANIDSVVREALVPGPTQFCVLIDENGDPETKKGPGRVWPGPNDRFRLEGSKGGVYEAYHIRTDRGLLLRVVAPEITKEELAKQLPKDSQLEKSVYQKGDEIFIGGFDAYFVPSKSVEVRNPVTRQPHIGNDHSEVYVPAIGVDQKSGIYVATLETGNIALVKGEKKVLPDPRRERHTKRRIPGKMFNLMIAAQEPHKRVNDDIIVETPWALSVIVPHNNAVLVTGKDNRRVVVGACRELLQFEEVLEVLELTKGRPKVSGNPKLPTCFLRIDGNRVTDQIELETADFVKVVVDVAYSVKFEGTTQEEMIKWFNFQNYILFLCDNLRSRLRATARQLKLEDLYGDVSGFVRNTILGKKPDGEGMHRPGMLFEENNMRVKEVEILSVSLPDEEIGEQLAEVNRKTVAARLAGVSRQVELESEYRENEVATERAKLRAIAIERDLTLAVKQINAALVRGKEDAAKDQELNLLKQVHKTELENTDAAHKSELLSVEIGDKKKRAENELAAQVAIQQSEVANRKELAVIEKELLSAVSAADVDRLEAVQPGLVEAIQALGNKELAKTLAENLPKAGGGLERLLGVGSLSALRQMVAGTPMATALDGLASVNKPAVAAE
ncbi:MAG: hypothetical protein WC668_03775 [Patescibacteria group bacterium]|jgi:hypothetical protein